MRPLVLAAVFLSVSVLAACGEEGGGGDGPAGSGGAGGTGGAGGASTTTTTTTDTTTTTTTSTTSTSMQSACEMSSADCEACRACATSMGSCTDELAACGNSMACTLLYDCVLTCETSCTGNPNPNCLDNCVNGPNGCMELHPAGVADYQVLSDCVTMTECPMLCGGAN